MMTKEQANELSLEANLKKMTQAHLEQFDYVMERIEFAGENGEFNTYIPRNLHPDVRDRLLALGYDIGKATEGVKISWL